MARTPEAFISGAAGLVSTRDGEPFSLGGFTVRDRRIVAIVFLTDPARLRQLDLTILDTRTVVARSCDQTRNA